MEEHNILICVFLLLLFTLPQSQSQPPWDCKEQPYNCGNLSDIFYPFWGQNRPASCGGGSLFNLHCSDDDSTTIRINSQNFTVLLIDQTYYTMKMMRTDLVDDACSPQFNDTHLNPPLFKYPEHMNEVTIFYNCSSSVYSSGGLNFTCKHDQIDIYHVTEGEGFQDLLGKFKPLSSCGQHIQVPSDDAPAFGDGGVEALKAHLRQGFTVSYHVDPFCARCLGMGMEGDCGTDDFEKHLPLCYNCPDGSQGLHCSGSVAHNHKRNQWNWQRKAIIGTSAAIAGLLICITIFCFGSKSSTWHGKFWLMTKNNHDIEAFLKSHGALTLKRYKFSDVKKMTNSFKVILGKGGFGAVYKGKLPSNSPVAVKILNSSKGNGEEFINEVASISRTSHVNVVALLGFCLEGRKKALIYEFMPNGSLEKFIYKKGPETIASLSWDTLYQIAIGIARGLEYLHRGCNTRILHFDIKPHNILLDENFCPKISDFGLAKLCPRKESIISMSDARGTMGYVAPEVWNRQFGGVSHKSDVYSYGMMLLEMIGGRTNINAEASQTSEIYFPHLAYKRLELGNDLRPEEVMTLEENEIAKKMTIVGLWCIQTFPRDRPTMSGVIDMLERNMNSLEIPPKPILSSPTRSVPQSSS